MIINIKTIPHNEQRYRTVGDWWFENNRITTTNFEDSGIKKQSVVIEEVLEIRVSQMSDWKREYLVAQHEMNEAMLAHARGIRTEIVDAFDIQYEKERDEGKHQSWEEPGLDSKCPVYNEHLVATGIEMILAQQLEVDWNSYSKEVENL